MPSYALDIIPIWGIRDPFSLASHLLGAVLSIPALVALIRKARMHGLNGWAVHRLSVYGVSMFLVFLASTMFHYTAEEIVLLKKLDHAAIFLVIGGTCTAIYGAIGARWCIPLILTTWLVLMIALVVKMLIWPMPLWMTALTYAFVGSLGGSGIAAVARTVQRSVLRPLLWGVILLVIGAVMFTTERPILWPGVIEGHELFHVLVLVAWALHFSFIYRHCAAPERLCAIRTGAERTTVDQPTGSILASALAFVPGRNPDPPPDGSRY